VARRWLLHRLQTDDEKAAMGGFNHKSKRAWRAGLAVTVFALGCAPLPRAGGFRDAGFGRGDDENAVALAATSGNLSVSTVTISQALDRIDQRATALDSTYKHVGTGQGVTVYVFDGGVSTTHPELAGRVRLGYTGFPDDPKICNAHGTAVAGAVAGATLGVAPDAEIVDVKMVECATLRGTVRAIVEGAKWVIEDHKVRGGPAIANWSFIADTSGRLPEIDDAVSMLRAAGIAVIVSAGNFDIDACNVSPGNAHGAFVVGSASLIADSTNGRRQLADRRTANTAYGDCVDLYAPGDSVLLPSLDTRNQPISQAWTGTSMATGLVSGAAALYLQLKPKATPDQVSAFLLANATRNVMTNTKAVEARLLYVGR
jgi:subtilisin family serine protease